MRRSEIKKPENIIYSQAIVGTAGFEPATPCTPSKCASRAAPRPEINNDMIITFFYACNSENEKNRYIEQTNMELSIIPGQARDLKHIESEQFLFVGR